MDTKPMFTQKQLDIRAYDIDAMGYVSNIVYVRWFEDLRHLFLDAYYPFPTMLQDKRSPVLMKTGVEYLKPLTIFDKPSGRSWMEKLGRSKWEMRFEIFQGAAVHCIGSQVGYFMDLETQRPAPFPDFLLQQYKKETELIAGTSTYAG